MSTPAQTADVVGAIRDAAEVHMGPGKHLRYNAIPYNLTVSILRHEYGYSEEGAHSAIFDAVMEGAVKLDLAKVQTIDRTETLCLATEDIAWPTR